MFLILSCRAGFLFGFSRVFFPHRVFLPLVFPMGDVEHHLPKYTYVVVYAPSSCILKVCVMLSVCKFLCVCVSITISF